MSGMVHRALYRDDVAGIAACLAELEAGLCPSCRQPLTRSHVDEPFEGEYGICPSSGSGYQCVRGAEGHAFLVIVSPQLADTGQKGRT